MKKLFLAAAVFLSVFSQPSFAGTKGFLVCVKGPKGAFSCSGRLVDLFRKYAGDHSCLTQTWNPWNQNMINSECEGDAPALQLNQAEERFFYLNCSASCAVAHFPRMPDYTPPSDPPVEYPPFFPGKAAGPILCSMDSQCGLGHCVDSTCQ